MANVNLKNAPKGFSLIPEGDTVLQLTKVEGLPRTNVEVVTVDFINAEGQKLSNKYDLTNDGGYAAFYYLATLGCGFEADEICLDEMTGKFVAVEIVHNAGKKPRADGSVAMFANIKSVTGPGKPFGQGAVAADDDEDSEDWD